MSRRPSRLAAASVLVALVGCVAACSDDRPERAVTVESKDSASSDAPEPGNKVEAPASSARDQLDAARIDAALLTLQDLPAGWSKSPQEEDDDDSEDTIEPASCQDVLDALDNDSADAAAEGEANFSKGGGFGTIMSHTISSYDEEVPADVAEKIADAFSECPSFTSTDSDGGVSEVTVSPMSFANLGDQTLAFTMSFESEVFTVSMNVAYVVVGHNVVALVNGGIGGADGAQLEEFAKLAVTKLEDAAA